MVEPLCPYFGTCGGCVTQHVPYEVQVENKRKTLAHTIHFEQITVHTDTPYFYRNRMDFLFHSGGLGFREHNKWWKVVDVEKCVISNERLNTLLQELRTFFNNCDVFDIRKHLLILIIPHFEGAEKLIKYFDLN